MKISVPIQKYEIILGIVLFLVQQLVLPVLLVVGAILVGIEPDLVTINVIAFAFNFVLTLIVFFRYLKGNILQIFNAPGRFLLYVGIGLLIYFVGTIAINLLITAIDPAFSNVNDAYIEEMTQTHYWPLFISTVFLVPVAEECMFRGVVFRGLHERRRVLAYILSIALFSGVHVAGYIGTESAFVLLLCFVQYIPAAFALAWTYERTDSVCASILMHTLINCYGMLLMR